MTTGRSRPTLALPQASRAALAAALWLSLGLGAMIAYVVKQPTAPLEKPLNLVAIYFTAALALDLFVGSSRRVSLQRISPMIVLALLVTPGIPATIALVTNLMATLALLIAAPATTITLAQAGKSLLPAALTALALSARSQADPHTSFLAAEVFLVVSLATRSSDPPFRSDIFLVISYPAVAFMLRSLTELSLGYLLLAIPLLFLLTTVDTKMLRQYFRLKKELEGTQTAIELTQRAQKQSERESRRKGILLDRRERQLELLNGLGGQLEEAKASDDLARFLIAECPKLIGAEMAIVLFCDSRQNKVTRIIPPKAPGLTLGSSLPRSIQHGISARPPWPAAIWQDQQSFLIVALGREGWLILSHGDKEAFPDFLDGFFSAVGRHAGSAALALRRLSEVRELASREAHEKEKVAEQNQNLRALISSFDSLTAATLSSQAELQRLGSDTMRRLTGADRVYFQVRPLSAPPHPQGGFNYDNTLWPSFLYLQGNGPCGHILCLSSRANSFSSSHLEWCTLLRDFLDKTLENGTLHRRIKASLSQLKDTQQEVVRSSQWAAAGRLAANAAHELNTPLGAIRLAAEQVKFFQGDTAPEPAKDGLASIIRSVDRCREVTDRLLITSRPVDHGENPTEPSSLRLMPVLRDALASVQPYLQASQIRLASHRLRGEYDVSVVLQDLYWAVVNVLKNGIDALNDPSITAEKRMAIGVEKQDPFIEITICDNGPGIPEDLQARIFEPFFTTKKIGSGNGLGLALAHQNLQRWGGYIKLGAIPVDGGACFIIGVPQDSTHKTSSPASLK